MCQDMSSLISCDFVYLIIVCIVCAIGLIGNTLSLAVLHKHTSGHVGTYLLEALALTDNMFLAISVCIDANYIISNYYNLSSQYYEVFQTYVWPLGHITHMWTIWMIVIVAGKIFSISCFHKCLHMVYI